MTLSDLKTNQRHRLVENDRKTATKNGNQKSLGRQRGVFILGRAGSLKNEDREDATPRLPATSPEPRGREDNAKSPFETSSMHNEPIIHCAKEFEITDPNHY